MIEAYDVTSKTLSVTYQRDFSSKTIDSGATCLAQRVENIAEERVGGVEVFSEADEVRVVRHSLGGSLKQVRRWVRVHGGEAGAALHEAFEVERDAVAGRADLDAGRVVVVGERFDFVVLEQLKARLALW